jgi:hypothetical protein
VHVCHAGVGISNQEAKNYYSTVFVRAVRLASCSPLLVGPGSHERVVLPEGNIQQQTLAREKQFKMTKPYTDFDEGDSIEVRIDDRSHDRSTE